MYAGKLIEHADLATLFKEAKHPYTQALLGSIPRLDLETERLRVIPGVVPQLINPPPGCRFHTRCEYVKEICRKEEPPLIEIKQGHTVACFLYGS
jgi:peptide/nickel transport system ATP-binding protein